MTKDEALDMALEFVEANHSGGPDAFELITAIKQARSAPVQEPAIKQGWDVDTLLDKPAAPEEPVTQDVQEKCRIEVVPAKGGLLPAAPVQEPVAWATMLGNYSHVSWGKDRPDYPIRYEVPLYTTPPAQEFVCSTGLCHYKEQPALKPLTNEQVGKAARDAHIAFCLNKHQTYEHALTRAVEAAHGITGETK